MKKKIHFEIVSRYDKKGEPAVVSVPFPKGELKPDATGQLCLRGQEKEESCPAQYKAAAFWPDGSVKWLLVTFLADLPANREKDFYLISEEEKPQQEFATVQVRETDGNVTVDNGIICCELAGKGKDHLFDRIVTPDHIYGSEEIEGPVIVNEDGEQFVVRVGEAGWEILEKGPVRAMLRAKGKHYSGEKSWFDWSVILTVWSGKPWLHLDYQIINREDDPDADMRRKMQINNEQAGLKYDKDYPYQNIKEMKLMIRPGKFREDTDQKECRKDADGISRAIYTSSFNYHAMKSGGEEPLSRIITADTVVNTANEMFPEVLFSIFTADWNNRNYALAAGIRQAYQNFPKAIDVSREEITISFLPEIGTMLKVAQGVAKTTRLYLYFHDVGLDERMLIDRAHQFEMPAQPVLEPECYEEAKVFEPYVSHNYHYKTERFLYRYVDSRAKGLGMLHFGDGPEWEYIKQGRSEGKLIWINNEYDMPHNFMIMLARTGDRRYFDYMKAAVEHWYDVDLCHYSSQPNKEGLLYTHSVDHVSGQPVPSHQWVEGFLDYYHLTGNPNGQEAALSIGEGLLELMKLPIYHATATVEPREIGWAMRTFMALYRETGEERWIEACQPIVEVYVRWAEELGTWTTPYPDNYLDRVPFMMHVGIVGLYQYDKERPSQVVKDTILQVVDDIIRYCYIPRADVFFGKQFPAVRFLNLNGMVLESLAIAYELTGKEYYINTGIGMFEWITEENQPPIYDFSKYKQDEYTVIYNCSVGPKRCAQSLLPLLHYYRCACDLGYLKNRERLGATTC